MFTSYAKFEITRLLRNPRYLGITLVFPPALYLMNSSSSSAHIDGLAWPAFFMVSMACYGALAAALNSSARVSNERQTGWVRQLRVTPLSERAWLGAKIGASLMLAVPAILILAALGAMRGVSGSAFEWVGFLLVLTIGSLPFACLGLAIGSLLEPDATQACGIAAILVLCFLGGLFYPLKTFPAWVRWIADALPTTHVADLARSTLAGHSPALGDAVGVAAWMVGLIAFSLWAHRRSELAVAVSA